MEKINAFRNEIEPLYQEMIQHPFNQELARGTLDENKFRFYLSQDTIYIGEYSRALAALASKAPSHSLLMEFISFAKEGLEIERELHDYFMKEFNVEIATETALSTDSYANFLLASVAYKSFEEALAGLLPCFSLYNEVAADIYRIASPANKYQKWINTYSSAEFDETTERLKTITNELALSANEDLQQRMKEQYIRSAHYEWLFWDSAYKLKYW